MAQIINMRENEYQVITSELAKMHTEQLESVNAVISEMKMLVDSEDAFYAEHTTEKMTDMLEAVSSEVMSLLKQAFQDSETGVANMIESIMTTDSVRG